MDCPSSDEARYRAPPLCDQDSEDQMFKYMGRFSLSLPLVLALAVGACRDSGDDQLAMDTSLNRDLELANIDTHGSAHAD
jgi:hypothetical protein